MDAGGDDVFVFLVLLVLVFTWPLHDQWHGLLHNLSWFLRTYNAQLLIVFSAALAAGTFLLFQRTSAMASATNSLAIETRRLADGDVTREKTADLHHRQSQAGLMMINNLSLRPLPPNDGSVGRIVEVYGTLKNVGFGPAIQLRVFVKWPTTSEAGITVGSYAAGEEAAIGTTTTPVVRLGFNGNPALLNKDDALFRMEWSTQFNHVGKCWYKFRFGYPVVTKILTPEDDGVSEDPDDPWDLAGKHG